MTLVSRLSFTTLSSFALAGLMLATPLLGNQELSTLAFHPTRLDGTAKPAPLPEPAFAVEPADEPSQQGIDRFDRAIDELMQSAGPFALELAELLQGKGMLLQNLGQHTAALDALESSMHILRVNHGLFNVDQIPVLRAMVQSKLELEDLAGADDLQAALFNLRLKVYGAESMAASQAYIDWADWNVSLYLNGSRASELQLQQTGGRDRQTNMRLTEAYNQYANALSLLQKYENGSHDSLVATERKLAAISLLVTRNLDRADLNALNQFDHENGLLQSDQQQERANMALFNTGSSALQRAIAYSINAPQADYREVAERMMELGDWYLLFDRRKAAMEIYQDVMSMLNSIEAPQSEIERILSAGLPVQTPDTAYQQQPEQYAGYIDVEFRVSKFGVAYDPEIIASVADDKRIERELIRTIRACKFRPKFEAGAIAALDKVQLRYYYSL